MRYHDLHLWAQNKTKKKVPSMHRTVVWFANKKIKDGEKKNFKKYNLFQTSLVKNKMCKNENIYM